MRQRIIVLGFKQRLGRVLGLELRGRLLGVELGGRLLGLEFIHLVGNPAGT